MDASADGYARGEAVGVYVLGSVSDKDKRGAIAAVLAAVVNQDGRSSSLTAPK